MLGDVVVGAGEEHAPVGVVGVARPHLVPGDDVGVAVEIGAGAERREVGAGVRLAEALAPAVATVHDPGEEPARGCRRCRARGCPARDSRAPAAAARRPRPARRRRSRRTWSAGRGRRSRVATRARRTRRRRARGATPPGPASSRRRSTTRAGRGCWSRARRAAAGGTRPPPARQRSPSRVPDPPVREHPGHGRTDAAEHVDRQQRPAQVHVREALPGVADAAVHLDRGLAHRAGGAGAVGLGDGARRERVGRVEGVDRPGRVTRDARRTLGRDQRVGQQVLHRLERADRHAVLTSLGRVLRRQRDRAAHDADEIGTRQREPERGPPAPRVGRRRRDRRRATPRSVVRDRAGRDPDRGSREVDLDAIAVELHRGQVTAGGDEQARRAPAGFERDGVGATDPSAATASAPRVRSSTIVSPSGPAGAPACRRRSAARVGPANGVSARPRPSSSATIATSTAEAHGPPASDSARSSRHPAARTAASSLSARSASSRSATACTPSRSTARAAASRSACCSGESRTSIRRTRS